MYLEQNILDQLRTLFAELRHSYTLLIERPAGAKGDELLAMITDFASVSDRLTLEDKASDSLCLTLLRDGQKTGITFRAIPSGHEFTSLILAVLNADGQGRNLPDEAFISPEADDLCLADLDELSRGGAVTEPPSPLQRGDRARDGRWGYLY